MRSFEEMERDERWLGFGYLGGRRNALDSSDSEVPAQPERVADIDARVQEWTHSQGWTDEELFDWANSKDGRYFADVVFDRGIPVDVAWQLAVYRWNLLNRLATAGAR